MAKEYRPYGLEQAYLLPQAPREWLPEGHLALFLEDAVSLLDIEEIAVRFKRGRGPRLTIPGCCFLSCCTATARESTVPGK